jgi:hypothetical protein
MSSSRSPVAGGAAAAEVATAAAAEAAATATTKIATAAATPAAAQAAITTREPGRPGRLRVTGPERIAALSTKNTMMASGNNTGSQSPMPPPAFCGLVRAAGGRFSCAMTVWMADTPADSPP